MHPVSIGYKDALFRGFFGGVKKCKVGFERKDAAGIAPSIACTLALLQ